MVLEAMRDVKVRIVDNGDVGDGTGCGTIWLLVV